MSFETKDVVARLEALERECGELRQSNTVLSMALIRLTEVVEQMCPECDEQAAAKVVGPMGDGSYHELPERLEGSD